MIRRRKFKNGCGPWPEEMAALTFVTTDRRRRRKVPKATNHKS